MEANPTSIEIDKLKHFKDAGVNRISIGIQSLQDHHLQFLGREHSTCDAINALEAAQKIFSRHTFDLIYALPNQSMKEWEADLRTAMELAGGHISLYQLTIQTMQKPEKKAGIIWHIGAIKTTLALALVHTDA